MAKKTSKSAGVVKEDKRIKDVEELYDLINSMVIGFDDEAADDDDPDKVFDDEDSDLFDYDPEDIDDEDFDPLDYDSEDLDDDFDTDDFDHDVPHDETEPGSEVRSEEPVKEEIPFYDGRYTPHKVQKKEDSDPKVDLENPYAIYEFLRERIYKQDKYCRDAAMILYNHIKGQTSANIVCGPAGCGKTHVWECLSEIYPKIIIVNAATITKDGWKGDNKTTSFLSLVDFREPDYIIVFDEFDKCAAPQFATGGENVSASVQSEFLKLVEGQLVSTKRDGMGEIKIDTTPMSFVFCGSFAAKAGEIAKKKSSNGFGFESRKDEVKVFASELTMKDVIDFGIIPELASRVRRLTNVRPLTLKDYCYLLREHPASPVKMMEKQYNMKLNLPKKKCEEIARNAFESGLGIRNATAQLQRIIDDMIFNEFMNEEVSDHVL